MYFGPAGTVSITNTVTAADDGTHGPDPTPGDNSDTDVDLTDSAVQATISKDDGLSAVTPGQETTYTLTIRNLGNEDAVDVVVTDTVPANTTFVAASDGGTETGGTVTWPSFALGGNGGGSDTVTRTVTVRVDDPVPAGVDTIDNAANVAAPEDVDPGDDDTSDSDTLDALPDLQITKDDQVLTAIEGQTLVYTLTITNVGNQGASGVVVSDQLPDGVTFVAASDGGADAGGTVTWPGFALAGGGASVQRTVTVTVDSPLPDGTVQLVNTTTVTDDGNNGTDPTPDDNSDTDTDVTGADLSITKDDGRTTAAPGGELTYTITVTNAGPETVADVVLTDVLPGALHDPVYAPGVGSYASDTGLWTGVDLAVGESASLLVTVGVDLDASETIVNTASVSPVGFADPTPGNNSDSDTDEVLAEFDLTLVKQAAGEFVRGDPAEYRFTVSNAGPSRALGVTVTDELPPGLAFVGSTGAGWTCSAEGQDVTCTYDDVLAPDGETTFTLVVGVATDAPEQIVNDASVSAFGAETDPTNNVGTAGAVSPTTPQSPGAEELPRTGSTTFPLLSLGVALIAVGAALVGCSRCWRRVRYEVA